MYQASHDKHDELQLEYIEHPLLQESFLVKQISIARYTQRNYNKYN